MKRNRIVEHSRKPRKIMQVKPSKYEGSAVINNNKKYWQKVFDELDGAQETTNLDNIINISDALPQYLSDKVNSILNISDDKEESDKSKTPTIHKHRRLVKEPVLSSRKTLKLDRELESDTDVECVSSADESNKWDNTHREFLIKPIRKQITWATRFLEPEKDYEKSLIRRADDLTDRIAREFSDYMQQLGGDQRPQLFNPRTIKELFQIDFDTHASRGLRVEPKELPTVNDRIAGATNNLQQSCSAALQREISKDIKAEKRPDNLLSFGKSHPRRDQWRNPRNSTQASWRSARHVPKDVVTLKTVWEGITHLRSVKDYCHWMIEHPEYKRPPYLASLGMFDAAMLDARLTLEMEQEIPRRLTHPPELPAPVKYIRRRLSELVDIA